MAVDLTLSFHVSLYLLFLESLLFFAVVMQTKSMEPGSHSGIARYFGMFFLFQSLTSLFLVLSEQLFDGYISLYFSILAVITLIIAVFFTVPAATSVAFPEPNYHFLQATFLIIATLLILLSTFSLSPHIPATPDIPYIHTLLRRELLGAIFGSILALSLAALVRICRWHRKGRNGAFILLAALVLMTAFGWLWTRFEPLCAVNSADDPWPEACPLPRSFDHNTMIALLVMVANVLAAEGVLRLMAAGTGVEGYIEIIPVINT